MSKSLQQLTKVFSDFCKARQWEHSDPNQLISSIYIELGELAEHYQWRSKFPDWDETERTEVGYEFVDVLLYFLRLAENSNIDIEKYLDDKLPKLAKKFPEPVAGKELTTDEKIENSLGSHKNYRSTGKNKLY